MSNGLVLSFLRRPSKSSDWTQQELAEFYRVESALLQGGLSVVTDRGISDEGDPWFIFFRADNEEVIAHFARIDHEYVVVSGIHSGPARGSDFQVLIRRMIDTHPLMLPIKRGQGQKVFLHPAALLTAMLASAYVLSSEKDLAGNISLSDSHAKDSSTTSLLASQFSLLASAVAAIWLEHQAESVIKFFENGSVLQAAAFSDDKATHLAAADHDPAPFDVEIMQAARGVGLESHRTDSPDPILQASEDGNVHGSISPTWFVNSNFTLDASKANLANTPTPSVNDQIAVAHSDESGYGNDFILSSGQTLSAKDIAAAVIANQQNMPSSAMAVDAVNQPNPASPVSEVAANQPTMPTSSASADAVNQPSMQTLSASADAVNQPSMQTSSASADAVNQPSMQASSASTDDVQTSSFPNFTAATNDAWQLIAAQISNASIEPVVLFNGALALTSALQQQVDFGTDVLQKLAADLSNSDPASSTVDANTASSGSVTQSASSAVEAGTVVAGNINQSDISTADTGTAALAMLTQSGASSPDATTGSSGKVTHSGSSAVDADTSAGVTHNGSDPSSTAADASSTAANTSAGVAQNSSDASSTASDASTTASIASVERTVEKFIADTPSYEIALSGLNVVIIDTNPSDVHSPHYGTLTFDMSDGSTLTIVGIIPHHHAAAAA